MIIEFSIITLIFIIFVYLEQNIRGYAFSFNFVYLLYGYLYSLGPLFYDGVSAKYAWLQFFFVAYVYIVSLVVSELILKKKVKGKPRIKVIKSDFFLKASMLIFVFICFLVMYYVVFIKIGLHSFIFESRSGRAVMTRQYSAFMFFKDIICAIGALSLLQYLILRDRFYVKLWVLCFVFSLIYSILTISRSHLIVTVFPVFFLLCYFGYIKAFMVNVALLFGILIALLWKWVLYSMIIGDGLDFSDFSFSLPSELYQWAIILKNISMEEITYGKSFLDALISFTYPFYHAEPLSIWYVNKFEPEVANIGGGRGFSLIAEIVLSFGGGGLFLVYGLIGAFFGLLTSFSRSYSLAIYIASVSLPYLHKFFRSEFLSITKTWWWYYIVSVLLLIFMASFFRRVVYGYSKIYK